MKALVKEKPEPGLWLADQPMPEIGPDDVLVKVHKTGICGTDVHIYNWDEWAQKTIPTPMTIGHEFVGQVAEVGSFVKDFHPGDIVSGEGHVVCGRCRNCLAGRRHLCKDTQGIGVQRAGAFAEYIAVPMTNVWAHDPHIPRDVQSVFDTLTATTSATSSASLRRRGLISVMTTCRAPTWRATAPAMMPIGPAPVISTSSPTRSKASAVWTALPSGSRIAPSSSSTSSGKGTMLNAGTRT